MSLSNLPPGFVEPNGPRAICEGCPDYDECGFGLLECRGRIAEQNADRDYEAERDRRLGGD